MASSFKTVRACAVGLILGLACESSDGADGGDSGGPVDQTPECAAYLTCATALSPDTAMALEEAYGANGTCWVTQGTADDCTTTCEGQLAMLQMDNPGEPACMGGGSDGTTSG